MKQTTKKSYELPSKKMGGPISGPGKLMSSQNSLKHGITAKQFLSTPEKERYEQLAKDLMLKYASDNPLVTLQIERIAKLQIQLDRVQTNIDVLYRRSELEPAPTSTKSHVEYENSDLKLLELKFLIGIYSPSILGELRQIIIAEKIASLPGISPEKLAGKNQKGDTEISPKTLMGAYFLAEADFYGVSIDRYLDDKISSINGRSLSKDLYKSINFDVLIKAMDYQKQSGKYKSVACQNQFQFRELQKWFDDEVHVICGYLNKIHHKVDPKRKELDVAFPNFDELDRLMRYQTTISRQLSTAIGELLVLAK